MSIPVDVVDLARALDDFDSGYLLTSRDGRVKAVTVEAEVVDGALRIPGPGRGSSANIEANAAVTVLFSPREHHGYSLLVDGTATVEGGPDGTAIVTPLSAVLHRPASHADGPVGGSTGGSACGHDCAPVT